MSDKQYLGDGVYVETDVPGYQVKLTAENNGQMNQIYLDRDVMLSLMNYGKEFFSLKEL